MATQPYLCLALEDGRVGTQGLTRLDLERHAIDDENVAALHEAMVPSMSSFRTLKTMTIVAVEYGPDATRTLGRMLFSEGVCPDLDTFNLTEKHCGHEFWDEFIAGSMEAPVAAIQLKSLLVRTTRCFNGEALVAAMAQSSDGPFSRLSKLEVYGNRNMIRAAIKGAEDAAAGDCAHDWTASITDLGVTICGEWDEVSTAMEGRIFPNLRRMWNNGKGDDSTLRHALRKSHQEGRRQHNVLWGLVASTPK